MVKIRKPGVAGTFYPADSEQLEQMLAHYLNDAPQAEKVPKAIIAPHAGYSYSGSVAATVYKRLQSAKELITKVVIIGPSHRVGFHGLAISTADQFSTPLGNIDVDAEGIRKISEFPFIHCMDQAFDNEHCLEVHLPFLQTVLKKFSLIPLIAGDASADQISEILELFWDQPETLIVISTDLSHFHQYETAQTLDKETSILFEKCEYEKLEKGSACGRIPVSGLLALARKRGLRVKTLDLRNSGDTAGSKDRNRVVGYGAYVVE